MSDRGRIKETDIAYIAGIIDGEGCLRIKKTRPAKKDGTVNPTYYARIIVGMTDKSAIQFIADTLGIGHIIVEKHTNPKHRTLYKYEISHNQAIAVLEIVFPYLRVKRDVAQLLFQLSEIKKSRKQYLTKITGYHLGNGLYGSKPKIPNRAYSDEYIEMLESLFQKCKMLNSGRGVYYV